MALSNAASASRVLSFPPTSCYRKTRILPGKMCVPGSAKTAITAAVWCSPEQSQRGGHDGQDGGKDRNGKAAPCSENCPFGLDARELVAKLQRGSFGPAYNLYRNAVAFPEIVARLCPMPCSRVCARSLKMGHLERAAIDFSRSREPARFSFPESEKRVAVVGADPFRKFPRRHHYIHQLCVFCT